MKPNSASPSYFIGWDVGAWSCDKNGKSRDAIVILDEALTIVGQPWRGNLRKSIVTATTTDDWPKALFAKCEAKHPEQPSWVTMAIDTPLGFSNEFIDLIVRRRHVEPDETSGKNCHLFRHTERHLFGCGLKPLSAIKDMIGSQATKGMHVTAKFAPIIENCGVWTDAHGFSAIETYPTACRGTRAVKKLLKGCKSLGHDDKDDARVCAVIAHLFATKRGALDNPPASVPQSEGWIWVPK